MRKAELLEMQPTEVSGKQRLVFEAPSRGLIGFRSAFATLTRGTGLMHRAFVRYGPFRGALDRVRKGVLVSTAGLASPPEMCDTSRGLWGAQHGICAEVCHTPLFWACSATHRFRYT